MAEPIPAHVVTGALGSGKTTVIARLLAAKPAAQNWVVLLNEFSEAGIDALTVASAARGAFDVRLIPGGCLCCAGEQDFRRNLQELVAVTRPDRIIIEPSGLGHPGGIVDELLGYESRGALRLAGIVALVDPHQLRSGLAPGSDALAQVEIADSLVLSKPDLAGPEDRARFDALVARLFPAKAWSGSLLEGTLLSDAFEPLRLRGRSAASPDRPAAHAIERRANQPAGHAHDRLWAPALPSRDAAPALADAAAPDGVPVANGMRCEARHLGHRSLSWVFPRAVEFSRRRLTDLLAAAGSGRVARLKGVFRVGEDDWVLAQTGDRFMDLRATSWRRDSRVEVLVDDAEPFDAGGWDAGWLRCQGR